MLHAQMSNPDLAQDSLSLEQGGLVIVGGGGADDLGGGRGADVIFGLGGADFLAGRAGDDILSGGDGDDILFGGKGADLLEGGGGADTFIFDRVNGADRPDEVVDLTADDIINLARIDADATQDGNQAFHLVDQFTGHAGELMLRQVVTIVGPGFAQLEGDVDGDGQADLLVKLDGDQSSFDHFVL